MLGRRMAFSFLLCISVLHPSGNAVAQDVKSTFDKSVDFKKYKKIFVGIELPPDSPDETRSGTHQYGDHRFHQPEPPSQRFRGR